MNLPPFTYWITGGALAAFAALVGTCIVLLFAWYRAAVTEFDSQQSKAVAQIQRVYADRVKDLLGDQIKAGEQLTRALSKDHIDQDEKQAAQWATTTRDLIASAYGDGEAALFMSEVASLSFTDVRGPEVARVRNWIDARLRRLMDLIPRTDTLQLRKGFDPDAWAKAHPSQPQ
jgi:hypothetical protein